jgi:hypothetical protein
MITESIPQIVWTANGDGGIDWCNENWLELTGLGRQGPLGDTWVSSIHPEDREEAIQRWAAAVASGAPYEIEYRIRRHDGVYRWFLVRAIPVVDSTGVLLQWFGTCTDIDDQKQTEARLRAATAESEQLNRLKDEFLATVSHELRTPLQSILGWARLLRAGHVSPEKSQKALETIERNAKAQSQLIEDILDVSRIVTGKARIRSEPVDVTAVLGAALDTTQPAARAKGVELTAEIASEVGVLIGDADRLQQVVCNLLSNAVKFTPPGGHVHLAAHRSESAVRIVVEDDGQGIPAHFLAYVFDRFRQAEGGPQRAQGGLGLGLSIVRHLVELHGGTVSVASAGEGRGATFAVELPPRGQRASFSPSPAPFGKRSDPAFPAAGALTGVRVLVVDDEPDARELISAILQQYGAIVSDAGSAEEALEILESTSFDVLVSDIGMPREDGYAFMRRIRARSDRPDLVALRAVALTAYARQEDQRLAREAGYQRHVAKPVEPAHLVSAVIRLAQLKPESLG